MKNQNEGQVTPGQKWKMEISENLKTCHFADKEKDRKDSKEEQGHKKEEKRSESTKAEPGHMGREIRKQGTTNNWQEESALIPARLKLNPGGMEILESGLQRQAKMKEKAKNKNLHPSMNPS